MTQITFGKFNGWTMEQLAQAGEIGRDYLAWCASNLRNPGLRRAAENALKANVAPNAFLVAQALRVDEPGVTPDEAKRYADEQLGQYEDDRARDIALADADAKLRQALGDLGMTGPQINAVIRDHGQYLEAARTQPQRFSSEAKRRTLLAALETYEEQIGEIFRS